MVASSKAHRLKPDAIDIRVEVDPVQWFLNERDDTRSSFYLEDAATEFHVQGLELDWACVAWDGDLRFTGSGWSCHHFRGDRWCKSESSKTNVTCATLTESCLLGLDREWWSMYRLEIQLIQLGRRGSTIQRMTTLLSSEFRS